MMLIYYSHPSLNKKLSKKSVSPVYVLWQTVGNYNRLRTSSKENREHREQDIQQVAITYKRPGHFPTPVTTERYQSRLSAWWWYRVTVWWTSTATRYRWGKKIRRDEVIPRQRRKRGHQNALKGPPNDFDIW